ncbi:MAG: MFS transporter, partial [Myxococcales bacterium]
YVGNNLGVALGAVLGGVIASHSFQLAFFGNACTYVLFLALFLYTVRGFQDPRSGRVKKEKGQTPAAARIESKTWLALGVLTVGMMMLVISYVQWQTTIPTYLRSLGVSLESYSLLWALNGVVIVAFQPVLSWMIRRFSLTLQAQIAIGAMLFAAAMLLVSVSSLYAAFFAGMFIITLGEMLVWPGVPAIAAVAVASAGNVLGAATIYALGRWVRADAHGRLGRWFQRRRDAGGARYARAEARVRRWGAPALLLTWLPIVGDLLVLAAGALGVRAVPFVVFTALGKALRYAAVAAAFAP